MFSGVCSIIRKDKARCENKKRGFFRKEWFSWQLVEKTQLREGENWRNDGRYSYRYTDVRTGKRLTVYAQDLPELREKEKQIAKDMEDNILTDGAIKKMTLNTLFERYMATRELADTTRVSYVRAWEE